MKDIPLTGMQDVDSIETIEDAISALVSLMSHGGIDNPEWAQELAVAVVAKVAEIATASLAATSVGLI